MSSDRIKKCTQLIVISLSLIVLVQSVSASTIKNQKPIGIKQSTSLEIAKDVKPLSSNSISGINKNNSTTPECNLKEFRCTDGQCIQFSFVCDGDPDCTDGLDENPADCKIRNTTCGPDKFRCKNGLCIPKQWQCDFESDCSDDSDEDPNICKLNKSCAAEEFTCKSGDGECIPMTWVCDQSEDCSDGSDEMSCLETCRTDEFTCDNKMCIQKRWRCDGERDCSDGSDEKDCPTRTCGPKQIPCDGRCVPSIWRCDGSNDCMDQTDEMGCDAVSPKSSCQSDEFQCKDSSFCIKKIWVCDGENDCPGGEDENQPQCTKVACRADQFQCKDHTCIPGHLMCSGVAECPDGSDELNCTMSAVKRLQCQKTEFDCGGGMCIPNSKVCDQRVDCPDGRDEPKDKCGVNECAVNNGGCQHTCVDTPVGHYCDCSHGYKLVNNTFCEDINECENPAACSQNCFNEIGSFKCTCNADYMRDLRNHTRCKAKEGHASLLFARRHDIRKISLDHNEMTSIVNDTKSATALDFVFRTGMIFWSDVSEQKIYKAPIDEGNNKAVVLNDQLVTADGLAVDWIYNHIYFTDTQKCTIELTDFNGNMGKVLIKDDLEIPRAIALDPIHGWMYYTDWGSTPKIERAGMDGSHRQAIISYNVKWPNGLTLDLVKERVYWVDAKLYTISSCNYDGTQRRVILYSADHIRHPFSITTFEDWVYWTDWDKAAVFRANKFNGDDVQPITAMRMLQHPMTIHVYHPYRQPEGINHCLAVNGHCSHLCLPAPQINDRSPKISCACPTGLKLMDDGLMCVEDKIKSTTSVPLTTSPVERKPRPGIDENSIEFNNKFGIDQTTAGPVIIDGTGNHQSNKESINGAIDYDAKLRSALNAYPAIYLFVKCNSLFNMDDIDGTTTERPLLSLLPQYHLNTSDDGNHQILQQLNDKIVSAVEKRRTSIKLISLSSSSYWNDNHLPAIMSHLKMGFITREITNDNDHYSSDNYLRWLCKILLKKAHGIGKNETSSIGSPVPGDSDSGIIAIIVIVVIIVIFMIAVPIILYCYRYLRNQNRTSMNFDNPVYKKTTDNQEDVQLKNKNGRTVDEEITEPLNKVGTNDFV